MRQVLVSKPLRSAVLRRMEPGVLLIESFASRLGSPRSLPLQGSTSSKVYSRQQRIDWRSTGLDATARSSCAACSTRNSRLHSLLSHWTAPPAIGRVDQPISKLLVSLLLQNRPWKSFWQSSQGLSFPLGNLVGMDLAIGGDELILAMGSKATRALNSALKPFSCHSRLSREPDFTP